MFILLSIMEDIINMKKGSGFPKKIMENSWNIPIAINEWPPCFLTHIVCVFFQGCAEEIKKYAMDHMLIIGGIAIGVGAIQVSLYFYK